MTTSTSIFHAYGAAYLARSPTLPLAHLTTMQALRACRPGASGSSLSPCQSCGHQHRLSHACGHRHGPQCQHQQARQWLQQPLHQQLPGPYVLSTFPIPETLRPCCRSPPRLASQAMVKASSAALTRLARDARFITSDIRRMMAETNDATPEPPATPDAPSPPCSGPHGGGALLVSMRVLPAQEACVETG